MIKRSAACALLALVAATGQFTTNPVDRQAYMDFITSLESDLPHFFVLYCGREVFDNPCGCDENGRQVVCNEEGHITDIILPDNRLFGNLDLDILRRLPDLRVIYLPSSPGSPNLNRNVLDVTDFHKPPSTCVPVPECLDGTWACSFENSWFFYCAPTSSPTFAPSPAPSVTLTPVGAPTTMPTKLPTRNDITLAPTTSPSNVNSTTFVPTTNPATTLTPTLSPSSPATTLTPTTNKSRSPTTSPSNSPTTSPSNSPTTSPSNSPTTSPSNSPTMSPSNSPTMSPSNSPTTSPSNSPTTSPSNSPTSTPTRSPLAGNETATPTTSDSPTSTPTKSPLAGNITASPTTAQVPTSSPTRSPLAGNETASPTVSDSPTQTPTARPTRSPLVGNETASPTVSDSTLSPSHSPTRRPTRSPIGSNETLSPTVSEDSLSPTLAPSPHTPPTPAPQNPLPPGPPTHSPSVSPTNSPTTTSALLAVQDMKAWEQMYDSLGGASWIACSTRSNPCGNPNCMPNGQANSRYVRCEMVAQDDEEEEKAREETQAGRLLQSSETLRITDINLPGNAMAGEIPQETLNSFTAVNRINLAGNDIVGSQAGLTCVDAQICFDRNLECSIPNMCGEIVPVGGRDGSSLWAPPEDGFFEDLKVEVEESVMFQYEEGQSNVYRLPSASALESCDFSDGILLASSQAGVGRGYRLPILKSLAGQRLYISSSLPEPGHENCKAGQRLTIIVQGSGSPSASPTQSPTAPEEEGSNWLLILLIVLAVLLCCLLVCCLVWCKTKKNKDAEQGDGKPKDSTPPQDSPSNKKRELFIVPRGGVESVPTEYTIAFVGGLEHEERSKTAQLGQNPSLHRAKLDAARLDRAPAFEDFSSVENILRYLKMEQYIEVCKQNKVSLDEFVIAEKKQLAALGMKIGDIAKTLALTNSLRRGIRGSSKELNEVLPPSPSATRGRGPK